MAQVNEDSQYNANLFLSGMGISPVLFAQNVIYQSTKTNNFINSGIITEDPIVGPNLLNPGENVVLPYFNDLDGEAQIWSDDRDINVNPISAGHENAVKLYQANGFGFSDLSKLQQIGDPLALIQGRIANYWKRQDTNVILSLLKGVLNNPKIKQSNVFDNDKDATFNPQSFEKAISLLADYQDNTFASIAVHPAVYAQMKSQNYINLTGNDTPLNRAVSPFGTYNGMNVVVDRQLPIDENGYATSYIFGQGAVMYSTAIPSDGGLEYYRHPGKSGGENELFSKRVYTAHVHGTTVADGYQPIDGVHYSNADLANPQMWDCVIDPLHVHIVGYVSKVDNSYATKFFDEDSFAASASASAATKGKASASGSTSSSSASKN